MLLFPVCLHDLLFRNSLGELAVDVVAVVSNHPDLGRVADVFEVPFRHIPVPSAIKPVIVGNGTVVFR